MADEKSLKFGIKSDDKGLKSFNSSLKDLKKGSDELNKSFSLLNKSFADMGKSLKDIGKGLGSFKKDLADLSKDAGKQAKELEKYIDTLKKLNTALNANRRPGASGSRASSTGTSNFGFTGASTAGGGSSPSQPLYVHIVGSNVGMGGSVGGGGMGGLPPGAQIVPAPGGGFIVLPPGGGPGGPGRGTPSNKQGNQPGMDFSNALRQLGVGLASVGSMVQSAKLSGFQNAADIRRTRGQIFNRMLGGDLSDVLAFQRANEFNFSANAKFGGTKGIMAGQVGNVFSSIGGGGQQGLTQGGAGMGVAGATAGAGTGLFEALKKDPRAVEAGVVQSGIDLMKQLNPEQLAVFQHFTANAQGMLGANRRLGNNAMQAAGAGARAGMMPAESWNFFTGGANKFGGMTMMGEKDRIEKTRMLEIRPNSVYQAPGANFVTREEKISGFKGLGARALDLQRKGFDANQMIDLMGTMSTMMTGKGADRLDRSEKILTNAVSTGIQKGIQDVQTLEALGSAVADAMTGVGGMSTAGQGGMLANLLTAGMNADTATPQAIQQRMQGFQEISGGVSNDPFLFSRNMARTRGTLGAGAGIAQTKALANAPISDLLAGSDELSAFGINSGQRMVELSGDIQESVGSAAAYDPIVAQELGKFNGDAMAMLRGSKVPGLANRIAAVARKTFTSFSGASQKTLTSAYEAFGASTPEDLTEMGAENFLEKMKTKGGMALGAAQAQAGIATEGLGMAFRPENLATFSKVFAGSQGMFEAIAKVPLGSLDESEKTIKAIEEFIKELNKVDLSKLRKNTDILKGK